MPARRIQVSPDPEQATSGDGSDDGFEDPVDEMVDESFPASDPPSGWAGEDPRDVEPAADSDDEAHATPSADS